MGLAEDLAKYAPEKHYKPATVIDKANEAVDIRDIYNKLHTNSTAPTGEYSSWKIFCPFSYEHGDGGLDKNCRLYPPSHIYCWAMHGLITPVRLFARLSGMPQEKAAYQLLEERGLLAPKNYKEQWEKVTAYKAEQESSKLGSKVYAIDALQTSLKSDILYSKYEFDESIRALWSKILTTLDLMWKDPTADVWTLTNWHRDARMELQRQVRILEGEASGQGIDRS